MYEILNIFMIKLMHKYLSMASISNFTISLNFTIFFIYNVKKTVNLVWKEYIKNINKNTNKDNIIELHCECSTIYY